MLLSSGKLKIIHMNLHDILKWRYATKKMNGETVPADKLNYILEAARLAPSSSGLQPYEIFVISDRKLLEKIRPISFDQSQITDASHLLVFAAWDGYSEQRIDKVFKRTVAERGLPDNQMDDYKNLLLSLYEPRGKEWQAQHAAKQAYIAFAMAIVAAAEIGIDATPMEGFDPEALDAILGLEKFGLKSAVILPIGYRDAQNDWLVNMKKVRTPESEFFHTLD